MTAEDRLAEAIRELLQERGFGKTICPSEAARRAFPESWRNEMERCREVAVRLAEEGEIEICQKGKPVPNTDFRGPIRLRRTGKTPCQP